MNCVYLRNGLDMLLSVIIYLLFSVPLLITLLSWRLAGDARVGWNLRQPRRGQFLWLTAGFALALPMLLSGLSCSLIFGGSFIYQRAQRALGTVRGEDYDIIFLVICCVAAVVGLIGFVSVRACWRRLKLIFKNADASQSAAKHTKPDK